MAAEGTVVCWPICRWPDADKAAWALNCSPGDPFDDPHYGATLRADSLRKIRKGYGRWLCFLAAQGWLDPAQPPLARVTRPRLRAYFRALRTAGNADYTIIGRFAELAMAMKILAPGQDVAWIRRPAGMTVYALLRKAKRPLLVPDSRVLFEWGLQLMERAGQAHCWREQLTAYRDGLLIAMLAARGRRLRSMALLRLGREFVRNGGRYRVELTPEQVKTKKPDRFDLPARLTPYVQHYLDVVRPALLGGRSEDALWIGKHGGKLTAKGIQEMALRRTRKRFGTAFGPHRFRHAIGTTAPLRDPAHPGVAAGLLGISAAVLEEHYNRAGQSQAATMLSQLIERRRRELSSRPRNAQGPASQTPS